MSPLNCRITTKNYTKNRGNLTLTDMNTCEIKKVQYTSRIVNRRPVCFFICVYSLYVICVFLSNQDVSHKQSGDSGQSQAEPGGQPGRSVTQVGVAARLGHRVGGGRIGSGAGELHLFRLVAVGHC